MSDTPPSISESFFQRLRGPFVVLCGLVLLDLAVLAFRDTWERHSPDGYAERVRGCAAQPRDFVLVGGSPVSEGLDPAILQGVSWRGETLQSGYAVGLPGGTTTDYYFATVHACPTPPKLLVYGITASDMNDRRNEPHGIHSLMSFRDMADLCHTRPDAAEWATRHYVQVRIGDIWSAFRYRHGIRMAAARFVEERVPGACPDAAREAQELHGYSQKLRAGTGYAPAQGFEYRHYDQVKANHWPQPPFTFLDRYTTGSHLRYLCRLMDWSKAHRTELVLLDMPVTADLEAQYPAAMAAYRRRLADVEADSSVIVLRADRATVGLTDADFADIIHLNRVGASKLSLWLRTQLETVRSMDHPATLAEVRRP
ncbi:MAG: hypothetical protein LC104_03365 [Bacteroidales bacterium]|nr:hypothetical protein [Bacteroidales bacterium]